MRLSVLALASLLAAGTTSLLADPFTPYSNVGNSNHNLQPSHLYRRQRSGSGIIAYFYSVSAATPTPSQSVTTPPHSLPFSHQCLQQSVAQHPGSSVVFDQQSRCTTVTSCTLISTTPRTPTTPSRPAPATSPDGDNHAYITPFNGTIGSYGTIVGTYVGMEDLPEPQPPTSTTTTTPSSSPTSSPKAHPQPHSGTQHLRSLRNRSSRRCRRTSPQIRPLTRCQARRRTWPPRPTFSGNPGHFLTTSPPLTVPTPPSLLSTPSAIYTGETLIRRAFRAERSQ